MNYAHTVPTVVPTKHKRTPVTNHPGGYSNDRTHYVR